MELRTTNANLRVNQWWATPADKIKLAFSKESVPYVINYGIKKGRYVVELSPIKKALATDPNVITLTINGVELTAI
jgi:hypothetical protein